MLLAIGAIGAVSAKPLRIVLSSPLADEGADPDGCTSAVNGPGGPAAWQVRIERLLLDGKSLVETSGEARQGRLALCVTDGPVLKDGEVALSFVAHRGGIARTAGIVLRYADPEDFYLIEADALSTRVSLIRIRNGERREIAARSTRPIGEEQHTLAVRTVDETFTVMFDGKTLFEAHDQGITSPGRVGIADEADSRTSFGDLFVGILK